MRTVSVRLMADVAQYTRNIRGAAATTREFVGELNKAEKAGNLDAVTDSATAAGIGMAAAFGYAAKAAMDFDKQMSAVSAATHASTRDIELLRQAALDAGKDTKYSATEAAKGITELSKAGVSTADVLRGGLKGALALASAGQLDVGEAAEVAASAMTQFKLKGDKIPHVADLLAAAAGKAQGTVHDMGMALNQAGLVAAQTGLTIEETTGGLAAFASAGLTGSDAGTSFKQMLLMLQAPSGKTKELMNELGISLYDNQGRFIGLTNFAGQLQEKLKTLTPEARAAAMAQIFGADATRAASVMYEQGADGIQKWIDKTNDAGYAAETSAKLMDNLAGDVEKLRGNLETMAIEAGSGANGGLRILVQGLTALVDRFASLPPFIGSTITVMTGLGAAAILAGVGWVKLKRNVGDALEELGKTGPTGERAAGALDKTGKTAAKVGGAFAVLQIAGAGLDSAIGGLNPQIEALSAGMQKFAASGEVTGEAARLLGADMRQLDQAMYDVADTGMWSDFIRVTGGALESIVPGMDKLDLSLANSKARLTALDQALLQMQQSGNAEQAAAVFQKIAERAREQGVSVAEVKKVLPGYAAALETAGGAAGGAVKPTDDLTGATKEFKTASDASTAAAKGQRDALVDLANKMKAETDPVFGLIDAQQTLAKAEKDVTSAIKEHGRGSDEAREATRKLTLAAIDLQSKAGGLAGTFDGKMTPSMYATLRAAGLTENQIRDVAGQFRDAKAAADKYDGKYRAQVSVDGDKDALGRLNRLWVYQQALKEGKITARFHGPLQGPDGKYYAEGGWTGPGSKYDEAGVVHADEFVIKKESRQRLEEKSPGLLDHLNRTGAVPEHIVDATPGYADGGHVSWPFRTTASQTRIPSKAEVSRAVEPALPAGGGAPDGRGSTSDWIVRIVQKAFPGMNWISKDRPGSRTLSGSTSYHSRRRAVDWPASKPLAAWFDKNYRSSIKELITPYQQYNIHNGRRHTYTGAVWRQHNFAGGNAHDHVAFADGGVIKEPVYGYGLASGRSYSFAERGPETVVPGYLPGGGASPAPTIIVQNIEGAAMHEATALLRTLVAVTGGVGDDVAHAFGAVSRQTVQIARSRGTGGLS